MGVLSLDKEANAKLHVLDEEDEKVNLSFNRFYLHFPANFYETYGFGSNEGGRIGLKDLKNTVEPKLIPRIGTNKIANIVSASNHSFVTYNAYKNR